MPTATLAEPTRDGLPPMPPGPPHEERHFAAGETMRQVVAGAAEGLVPGTAVAAALSLAGMATPAVLAGGLASLAAFSVAGALERVRAVRAEAALYAAERLREEEESHLYPEREKWEVAAILHRYGVRGDVLRQAVEAVAADRRRWVDFMMRFELDLSEPDTARTGRAALVRALAQGGAGILPLLPYVVAPGSATGWSCLVAGMGLVGLGWLRARGDGLPPAGQALRVLGIGAAAAGVAALVARLVA
ncbi:VIT1/CCC1 transporter family protein [Falsiroseomonas sp. E2-1-a20]|uniref:VIT1/CCC1 transporter family protein n=1 Tax=Falsiroseomonas sp. E2-1-a20 TaxID=3239300 RepID=UPI003F390EA9